MTRYINKRNQFLILLVLLLFLAVFASACQMREKGRKPSADWSRSVPLGVFVRGDIDMVVSPDGTNVHLVWLKEEEGQNIVHYVQLDQSAVTQIARNLDLAPGQIRSPQLVLAGGSSLHLIWSSRPEGERQWDLWYGRLNQAGELEGEARLLAPAVDDVDQFVKISDGQGGVYVAWEARTEGALYGTHIDAGGQLLQERVLLTERGQNPSLATAGNQLFMTWITDNNVYFGPMPAGELSEVEGVQITTISLGDAIALDGPILGLSGDWAYVIWGIFNVRGLEAGTGTIEYLAFPRESPTRGNGEWLKISPVEKQPYAPYDSAYGITQLAPPAETADSTDVVLEPFVTTGRGNELAVAAAISQDFRLDTITQVGIIIFADGEFTGYQMAGKTEAFSQEPVLATDGEGNLYIAWRDGGQGSLAYYALTEPDARAQLDRMQAGDIANMALNGGFELITGILFFPLACVWLFPGLFLIGLWHYWHGESEMNEPVTIVILVIAIVFSQAMKFLFLPTITTYIPFSAWMDVSSNWEQPLRYIVPLFTMSIGLLVAWLMRRRTHSALAFFLWFMATDAILTLAIYGVTFLGVS